MAKIYVNQKKTVVDLSNCATKEDIKKLKETKQEITDDSLQTSNKTIVGAINELFQNVSSGKELIAEALTDRGIPSSAEEKFKDFSDKIDSFIENTLSLQVTYTSNTPGNMQGRIVLKRRVNEKFASVYQIKYADADSNPLSYEPICTMDLTMCDFCVFEIKTPLQIPYDAKKLIAVNEESVVDSVYSFPQNKLIETSPNYSFGLLADVHIKVTGDKSNSSQKLENAFRYFIEEEKVDFITIAGDIITSGAIEELVEYKRIRDLFKDTDIYCSRGNHDTYHPCTADKFIEYVEPNGVNFEKIINGDVHIYFGLYMEDQAFMFRHEDLDWLEQRLEAHINERVFLFQHVFVEPVGNASGTYQFSTGMIDTKGTPTRRFRDMVKKYRNVIHIAGHSHHDFSMERFSEFANCDERTEKMCHRIHIPSGARPRVVKGELADGVSHDYEGSQGYVVDVYDDCVVFRGYDFTLQQFDSLAHYCIDTKPLLLKDVNDNNDTGSEEYPYVTNFNITAGSLSSSGEERESESSYRTDFIPCNNDNPNKKLILTEGLSYIRICYYDINKNFLRLGLDGVSDESYGIPNDKYADMKSYWAESGKRVKDEYVVNDITDDVAFIRIKAAPYSGYTSTCVGQILFNGVIGEPIVYKSCADPIVYPEEKRLIELEMEPIGEELGIKENAKNKALNFIRKRHIPIPSMKIVTKVEHTEINPYVIGYIPWLENPAIVNNKIIEIDKYFDIDYQGLIYGTWFDDVSNPEDYRVDVYVITDNTYFVESCDLLKNRTWSTTRKATKGVKHIEVVNKLTGEIVEYAYPRVDNYYAGIYHHTDNEYEFENNINILFNGNEYIYYPFHNELNLKNPKNSLVAKVFKADGTQVSRGGCYEDISLFSMISSYLLHEDDPLYNSMGVPGTERTINLMNTRSFIYDIGLVLLVYAIVEDYDSCAKLIERLAYEQNEDGSFNFSLDMYAGRLSEAYVRTGAMGWLIWGICYYCKKSGDMRFNTLLEKAGEWILSKQILDEDDPRYGLLTGGYGSYSDPGYVYDDNDMIWCSTEHNCSSSQALYGLYHILGEEKYLTALNTLMNSLITKLYDSENNRFYQGINLNGVDDAWALDCLSWAGKTVLSWGDTEKATACANVLEPKFLVKDKTILVSSEQENYNVKYSLPEGVTINGFCPYADGYNDPPQLVWSEGTLGVIALYKALGKTDSADRFLAEMFKLQNCINGSGGLLYTTETRASLPWEFHAWESVVGSAWLILDMEDEDVLFNLKAFENDFKLKVLEYKPSKLITECPDSLTSSRATLYKGEDNWYINDSASSFELSSNTVNKIFYYFNDELINLINRDDVISLEFKIENVSEELGNVTIYYHNANVHMDLNGESNLVGSHKIIDHAAYEDITLKLNKDDIMNCRVNGVKGIAISLNSVSSENEDLLNRYSTTCEVKVEHNNTSIVSSEYVPEIDDSIEYEMKVTEDRAELFIYNLNDMPTTINFSNVPVKEITSINNKITIGDNIIFGNQETLSRINLSINEIRFNSAAGKFSGYSLLEKIDNIENVIFDESVKDISNMFNGCSSIKELDLSNWDVKNIDNMTYLFKDCISLESLDLRDWDINESAILTDMFSGCTEIKEINLKNVSVESINKLISALPTIDKEKKSVLYIDSLTDNVDHAGAKSKNWDIEPFDYFSKSKF